MRAPTVIAPREGEVIGDAPDRRVEMLSDHDALHATWSRFGPGRDGADLHVHREHTDLFFVLRGELTVRLGPEGEERSLPPGTLAEIPPLVVHGFRNASDAELRYLNFHAPGRGFAAYMRGLRDGAPVDFDQHPPPADGGRPAAAVRVAEAAGGEGERVLAAPGGLRISVAALAAGDPGSRADVARDGPQWLYVLDGRLELTAADPGVELVADAGAWVHVPAGASVSAAPPAGSTARVLALAHR